VIGHGYRSGDAWPELPELPLVMRLQKVRAALAKLQISIREQCPGPHRHVEHADGKPPWCDACGFTDTGLHRNEFGQGKP
jgi:hypothetical protein